MDPELWRSQPALVVLSWLPVPLGTLALWLPLWPPFARRFSRPWVSVAFFLLTRVALAWIVFGAFAHRSWDWQGFVAIAQAAMGGAVPYRDFPMLFAPGMPYLLALGVALSPAWGLLALFIAADLGAWLALGSMSGGLAPRRDSAAWCYLAFPPVWYFEVRYAQEEAIAALFLALGLLFLVRRRGALAGIVLAVGQLATKVLFGLGALPLLVARSTSWTSRLAFLVPVVLVYGALTALGIPWLRDTATQAGAFGTGPTLWRLPALWMGLDLGRAAMFPFILALVVGWWRLLRRGADGIALGAWLWGCFALLAPKLLPMYVVMVAPLLALWVARGDRGRFLWWGFYGFTMASAWYADSGLVQGMLGPGGIVAGAAVLVAVVILDVWLISQVARSESDVMESNPPGR